MCGTFFSVTFLCVHVWCVVLLFSGGKKKHMILCRGGVKFVTNTSPALVTFFSPPPPPKKKEANCSSGGDQICEKYVPSTCYIFYPPRYKNLTTIRVYHGISLKKILQLTIFTPPPPPDRAIKGVVIQTTNNQQPTTNNQQPTTTTTRKKLSAVVSHSTMYLKDWVWMMHRKPVRCVQPPVFFTSSPKSQPPGVRF